MTLWFIPSRAELPHILNARRRLGEGAEVGVERGRFSEYILSVWRGRRLHSVDAWIEMSGHEHVTKSRPQSEHDRNHEEALERLCPYGERSRILRMLSVDAAKQFDDKQLDFVYIDADHHKTAVTQDIEAWYPKLMSGGILSGHDYLDGEFAGSHFGVKSAVDEFVKREGLRLYVSREPIWRSWFVVKP